MQPLMIPPVMATSTTTAYKALNCIIIHVTFCYEPRVRRFHMTLDKSHLLGISHYDSFRGHRVSWLTHSTSHTCYMLIDCAMTHLSHMMLRECMSHSCDS